MNTMFCCEDNDGAQCIAPSLQTSKLTTMIPLCQASKWTETGSIQIGKFRKWVDTCLFYVSDNNALYSKKGRWKILT